MNTLDKLSLFLPLDASTTYVEHLRSEPSALSTPASSAVPSPKLGSRVDVDTRSHLPTVQPLCVSETTPLLLAQIDPSAMKPSTISQASFPTSSASLRPNKVFTTNDMTTPATTVPNSRSRTRSQSNRMPDDIHSHHPHPTHHVALPRQLLPVVDFIEVLTNSPRICRLGLAGENQHHHHPHEHEHHGEDDGVSHGRSSRRHSFIRLGGDEHDQHHFDGALSPGIGRKRQIVSILVSPSFPLTFSPN